MPALHSQWRLPYSSLAPSLDAISPCQRSGFAYKRSGFRLQGSQTFACRRSSIIRVGPAYNPVGTTPQDEQFMENTP
ncbi:hypothetical protein WJX79_011064 [Trebouxia sp. C0005]